MSILNLFRPKWQHSDSNVRLQAVQSLNSGDQEILATVARSDQNVEVRRAALRKLTVPNVLRDLAQSESDSENRSIAQTRLQDEWVRHLKTFQGTLGALEMEMLKVMEGSRHVEDLLRNAVSSTVRGSLVQSCTKQGLLVQVALKDLDESVALQALAGIDRENLLAEVAGHSRHASVRQKAQELLKAQTPDEGDQNAQQLEQRKRDVLLAQAQRLAEMRDSFKAESEFEVLAQEAQALGMGDSQGAFDSFYATVREKSAAERERLAAEAREKELQARQASEQASLLQELESWVAQRLPVGAERLQQISQQWQTLGGALSASHKRFSSMLERLARTQEEVAEAQLNESEIAEARESVIAQLNALVSAESLDDSVERQLRQLVRTWENLPLVEGDDPRLQNYIHLRDQLSLRLRTQSEAREQAYEAKLAELRAIIAGVEAIDENQDFREISRILRQSYLDWKTAVGEDKFQYQEVWKEYRKATARFQEMQQWESWHNERDREALIEEMSKLTDQEPSPDLLTRVRQLQVQWKNVGPVGQVRLQELWLQFKGALDQVMDKCRPFIEEQNKERQSNLEAKVAICEQVETLAADSSDNWKEKHKDMQAIQEAWKNAGPVPKEHNQPLWDRFRAACDVFYGHHKEFLRKEDGDRQVNLEQKEALCVQAESLRDSTDWNAATARLKKLQDEWKASGPVPKSQSETIWNRFREACDTFFERKRAHFEQLDTAKVENLQRKEELCAKLESMELDPANPEVVAAVEQIESEWKSIGMVPKDSVDALWDRYCAITDRFLESQAELKPELKVELSQRQESKQGIIDQVVALTEQAGSNQTADQVRVLQDEWKQIGRCGVREQELYRKFREVCDEFFTRRRDQLEIQEQARLNNLQKKQMLCEQAERLLSSDAPQHEAMNEVKHLRRLWKEVGAVPREHSDKIWKRFNSACDAVFAQGRPQPENHPAQAE